MFKIVTFLAFSGVLASAQYSFGEKNKEYSGSGKYVTILEEQKLFNKSEYYGASVVGSVCFFYFSILPENGPSSCI